MINTEQDHELLHAEGDAHLVQGSAAGGRPAPRKMGFGQKLVVALLLAVVLVPPLAGFYSYFTGIPLHLLAAKKEDDETDGSSAQPSISLVEGRVHTLALSDEVATTLGVAQGRSRLDCPRGATQEDAAPGATRLDGARSHAARPHPRRFAPARVVEIAHVRDPSRKSGQTEFRELRQGDAVSKGDLLGVFYSLDVGSKKNDLLDALVQLELDQTYSRQRRETQRSGAAEVFMLTADVPCRETAMPSTGPSTTSSCGRSPRKRSTPFMPRPRRSAPTRASGSRPRKAGGSGARSKPTAPSSIAHKEDENPWGRVTLRVPFDGVVVERNVHVDEMVVDNTVNLFQIADVSRLLVVANCPEDDLPALRPSTATSGNGPCARWARDRSRD